MEVRRREIERTYLLDTCALLWIAHGTDLREPALSEFKSLRPGQLFVSPMSAWEIAMLAHKQKLILATDAVNFFRDFCDENGIQLENLSPVVLASAVTLPQLSIQDPVDRILISAARQSRHTLVTRDGQILAYGEHGHVSTLEC